MRSDTFKTESYLKDALKHFEEFYDLYDGIYKEIVDNYLKEGTDESRQALLSCLSVPAYEERIIEKIRSRYYKIFGIAKPFFSGEECKEEPSLRRCNTIRALAEQKENDLQNYKECFATHDSKDCLSVSSTLEKATKLLTESKEIEALPLLSKSIAETGSSAALILLSMQVLRLSPASHVLVVDALLAVFNLYRYLDKHNQNLNKIETIPGCLELIEITNKQEYFSIEVACKIALAFYKYKDDMTELKRISSSSHSSTICIHQFYETVLIPKLLTCRKEHSIELYRIFSSMSHEQRRILEYLSTTEEERACLSKTVDHFLTEGHDLKTILLKISSGTSLSEGQVNFIKAKELTIRAIKAFKEFPVRDMSIVIRNFLQEGTFFTRLGLVRRLYKLDDFDNVKEIAQTILTEEKSLNETRRESLLAILDVDINQSSYSYEKISYEYFIHQCYQYFVRHEQQDFRELLADRGYSCPTIDNWYETFDSYIKLIDEGGERSLLGILGKYLYEVHPDFGLLAFDCLSTIFKADDAKEAGCEDLLRLANKDFSSPELICRLLLLFYPDREDTKRRNYVYQISPLTIKETYDEKLLPITIHCRQHNPNEFSRIMASLSDEEAQLLHSISFAIEMEDFISMTVRLLLDFGNITSTVISITVEYLLGEVTTAFLNQSQYIAREQMAKEAVEFKVTQVGKFSFMFKEMDREKFYERVQKAKAREISYTTAERDVPSSVYKSPTLTSRKT